MIQGRRAYNIMQRRDCFPCNLDSRNKFDNPDTIISYLCLFIYLLIYLSNKIEGEREKGGGEGGGIGCVCVGGGGGGGRAGRASLILH